MIKSEEVVDEEFKLIQTLNANTIICNAKFVEVDKEEYAFLTKDLEEMHILIFCRKPNRN